MATIYTRASKGSALTWTEGDANITNLNNDKMENFTVAGDSGANQTISGGNTLTISGGTGLSSVASATDTLTINLDNTTVTPASYTFSSITVDAQGRITSASNGTAFNGTVGATTPNTGTFTTLTVNAANELRLADSDSSNYIGFKSPATVTTNKIWTLPAADGTSGQVLSTDGAGVLSWATAGGGGSNLIVLMSSDSNGRFTLANADNTASTSTFSLVSSGGVSGVSVSTNTFTLPAGTYHFYIPGTVKTSFNSPDRRCQIKLTNTTDSTTTQTWDNNGVTSWAGSNHYFWWNLTAYFTITGTKTYQIRTASIPAGTSSSTSPVIVNGNEASGEKFMFYIHKLS